MKKSYFSPGRATLGKASESLENQRSPGGRGREETRHSLLARRNEYAEAAGGIEGGIQRPGGGEERV